MAYIHRAPLLGSAAAAILSASNEPIIGTRPLLATLTDTQNVLRKSLVCEPPVIIPCLMVIM